jgi:hypothetical protein
MSMRVVLRWAAMGAPYPWFGFATRFHGDRVIGPEFFRQFAESVRAVFNGHVRDAGLLPSFDDLESDWFESDRVHPLIRRFYEHTSQFDMHVEIKWEVWARPFGALYRALVARQMQNLRIPLDSEEVAVLDSWLDLIDLEGDGRVDVRCWIRVSRESHMPIYVGAYKAYRSEIDGARATYISVAFPIPHGTLTTVLLPCNWGDDGLLLTTRDRRSSESGVYLLLPHGQSFSMTPALGLAEEFRLHVCEQDGRDIICVQHDCFWLGRRAFQMRYHIFDAVPVTPGEREVLARVAEKLEAKAAE